MGSSSTIYRKKEETGHIPSGKWFAFLESPHKVLSWRVTTFHLSYLSTLYTHVAMYTPLSTREILSRRCSFSTSVGSAEELIRNSQCCLSLRRLLHLPPKLPPKINRDQGHSPPASTTQMYFKNASYMCSSGTWAKAWQVSPDEN